MGINSLYEVMEMEPISSGLVAVSLHAESSCQLFTGTLEPRELYAKK